MNEDSRFKIVSEKTHDNASKTLKTEIQRGFQESPVSTFSLLHTHTQHTLHPQNSPTHNDMKLIFPRGYIQTIWHQGILD